MIKNQKGRLWADIFAPKHINQLIGNSVNIRKFKDWMMSWMSSDRVELQKVSGKKKKKTKDGMLTLSIFLTKNSKCFLKKENLKYNAVLLSGLPGIGKTTSARLIPRQLGFNTIEQNASDLRNSSSIQEHLTSLIGNTTFSNNWEALCRVKSTARPETTKLNTIEMKAKKSAIVMDEVDGMASDRGGINALIQFIKTAKQPIICICNDRNHPKIRTLATHCLDLQFKQPTIADMQKLLRRVEATLNIYRADDAPDFVQPDQHILKNIMDVCKGDIRQALNHKQLWYNQLGTKSVKKLTQKDLDNSMNINDAAMVLLNAHQYMKPIDYMKKSSEIFNKTLLDKLGRLTFVDYELLPFFFFESHMELPGTNTGGFGRAGFMMKKFGNSMDVSACGFRKIKATKPKFRNNLVHFLTSQNRKSLPLRPWRSWETKAKKKLPVTLAKMQLSLNSMVLSDQLNSQIRSTMNFGNLRARNFSACVYPGLILERNVLFPNFPSYLGKIGTMNKVKRFTKECREIFAVSQNGKKYFSVFF